MANLPGLGRRLNRIYYVWIKDNGQFPKYHQCKIPGVRFWRLLVGVPDFTLGGGRYAQVLKSARRNSRASRKIPATLDMLSEVALHRNPETIQGVGIACDAVVGFFILLRVGELESLRRMDASLSIDDEGDSCLMLSLPLSKTDQNNEGHIKVLKATNRPLCPVRHMDLWMGMRPDAKLGDESLAFNRNVRGSLSHALKLAAVAVGADRERVSNRSLRSGGIANVCRMV